MNSLIVAANLALRTLYAPAHASRPTPRAVASLDAHPAPALSAEEKALSGALMRVNHVGEICAQALYNAQSMAARNQKLKARLAAAGAEETDHLAWTKERLDALGARPSLLNPLWYAGAFGLGLLAGRFGDGVSLGFVQETENQVEAHLHSHLSRLPLADTESRAVVEQMKRDEQEHAAMAARSGATPLPPPVKLMMKAAAKVMTTTAHYI